jgi:AraC-like DNA-binding protein
VTRSWRPTRSYVEVTGVRLAFGALPAVTPAPASSLVNRRIPLRELWGGDATAQLHDDLRRATTPERRVTSLQEALQLRCAAAAVDRAVTGLIERLAAGASSLHQAAADLGLSERQLRRRYVQALGYPPSELARLLRLHRFLIALTSQDLPQRGLARLAADAGYADQSHLTRDCLALTGSRPSALLAAVTRR